MSEKKEAEAAVVETVLKGPANAAEVEGSVNEKGKVRDAAKEAPVAGAVRRDLLRARGVHWTDGEAAVQEHHGADVSTRAYDLVKRALDELYEENQGGPTASPHAHEVADHLHDAAWLNTAGDRFQMHEGAHPAARLNQRGYSIEG